MTAFSSTAKAIAPNEGLQELDLHALRRLDMSSLENRVHVWDTLQVASALQGLVNRISPRLYMLYVSANGTDVDEFWLRWMQDEYSWPQRRTQNNSLNIEGAITRFRSSFEGLVVYDPKVPATSNVASTVSGCDDLLPVRFDMSSGSLYRRLTEDLKIPVAQWLVKPDGSSIFTGHGTICDIEEPSSGSAKIDAYRWAIRMYLESGKCDPAFAAYYVDAFWLTVATNAGPNMHTLTNHDYFISKRAFFFDLAPWGDEPPNDDVNQPMGSDLNVLTEIFAALEKRTAGTAMIKVGGFPPWPFKYTNHVGGRHAPVPTENKFVRLISQFNGYIEADAAGLGALANASFFQHFPLPAHVLQPNPVPTRSDWVRRGYMTAEGKVAPKVFISHYVGDYDSPSWLYQSLPKFFSDPARGRVPLNWAIDPNLSDRVPQAMLYAYRNASLNDYFVSGDSGAGYLNPRGLTERPDSHLISGLPLWTEHNQKYYSRWDMGLTGFVIDGASGPSGDLELHAYRAFSPEGVGTQNGSEYGVRAGVPICREHDLPDDVYQAAERIYQLASGSTGTRFLWLRSVLKSPSWYLQLTEILHSQRPTIAYETVDAFTFFGLVGAAHPRAAP